MYSRSYYADRDDVPKPPENYNGTVFLESSEQASAEPEKSESKEVHSEKISSGRGGLFSMFPKSIELPSFLGRLGIGSLSLPKIGTEELLIIAVAAYLFFSKDGDKECAFMLILLLLVN